MVRLFSFLDFNRNKKKSLYRFNLENILSKKSEISAQMIFFAILLVLSGIILISILNLFGVGVKMLLGFPDQEALNNFDRLNLILSFGKGFQNKVWFNTLPDEYAIIYLPKSATILEGTKYDVFFKDKSGEVDKLGISGSGINANTNDPQICLLKVKKDDLTQTLKVERKYKCKKVEFESDKVMIFLSSRYFLRDTNIYIAPIIITSDDNNPFSLVTKVEGGGGGGGVF
jgi:hypothetical protein